MSCDRTEVDTKHFKTCSQSSIEAQIRPYNTARTTSKAVTKEKPKLIRTVRTALYIVRKNSMHFNRGAVV